MHAETLDPKKQKVTALASHRGYSLIISQERRLQRVRFQNQKPHIRLIQSNQSNQLWRIRQRQSPTILSPNADSP